MSKHLTRKTVNELATAELTQFTLLLDEDLSRITQLVFQPSDQTSWHRHEYDYVTEQQLSGALLLQGANGSEKRVDDEDGLTMSCAAPVKHNATSVSDVGARYLEIEYK